MYIPTHLTLTIVSWFGITPLFKSSLPTPSSRNRIPGSLDAICRGSVYEAERCAACGGAIRLHAGAGIGPKTTNCYNIGSTGNRESLQWVYNPYYKVDDHP